MNERDDELVLMERGVYERCEQNFVEYDDEIVLMEKGVWKVVALVKRDDKVHAVYAIHGNEMVAGSVCSCGRSVPEAMVTMVRMLQ